MKGITRHHKFLVFLILQSLFITYHVIIIEFEIVICNELSLSGHLSKADTFLRFRINLITAILHLLFYEKPLSKAVTFLDTSLKQTSP